MRLAGRATGASIFSSLKHGPRTCRQMISFELNQLRVDERQRCFELRAMSRVLGRFEIEFDAAAGE